ncbi:MAG: hypothetical protein OXU54_03270, partial [Gammaproteobacteria bacterium]|nr:hypothetical protein [Gammaproteobacteria bacterium]
HSLESRNPAQIERGTRTLQNLTARSFLQGIFLQRSARRALSMRDSGFRRNDMEGAGMTWRRPEWRKATYKWRKATYKWRIGLYSLDARRVFAQTVSPE